MAERERYSPGTFCWADLGTTDAAAAKEFYPRVFGWEAVDTPAGDDATYTMFRIDGPHLCWVLENLVEGKVVNRITVDPDTTEWAKVALQRMLEIV